MSDSGLPILVVEDEEILLSFLQTALERGGISVVGASTGEQALELLAQRRFAGVVSDLLMPGPVGGSEIYDWVSRHCPELKPCFLFITGNVMDEFAVSVRERTGALFIQKPFRISLLIELIHKAKSQGKSHV